MRKKIAILLTSEPQNGGEHQYLSILMDALEESNGKFFDVMAICYTHYWIKWCREHDIFFVRDKVKEYNPILMQLQTIFPDICCCINMRKTSIGRIVHDNKIDVLVKGRQGNFIPQLKCKMIAPIHDLMHLYEPDFKEIKVGIENRTRELKGMASVTDVILVDSKLGKKQFLESYWYRKRGQKVKVLPFTTPKHIENSKEEYIRTPEKYVFYPAQFWEHKNHINLLKAIKILRDKGSNISVIFVGSEKNSLKEVKTYIAQNKLESAVMILGFVSNEQITYLYKHALALVMPTYFGPTNIPPLEAMALGCPVIVSNKYAMKEQVGKAGLLIDPDSPADIAECIEKVDKNSILRNKMIEEGYHQSRRWTPNDFKRRFVRILRDEI